MRKWMIWLLPLLAGIVGVILVMHPFGAKEELPKPTVSPTEPVIRQTEPPKPTETSAVPTETVPEETEPAPTEPYASPIDFAALQEENPDIYAWLEIPGTGVSFPLLQRVDDDTYYLTHDYSGEEVKTGAVFSEATYNGTDMRDYVTFVYAHYQGTDRGFGQVQALYSDEKSFRDHDTIIVYTPEEEFHYKVWAAVTYKNIHVPYHYNHFDTERMRNLFIQSVASVKGNDANIDIERTPGYNEHLLVLSTCKSGFFVNKYIVVSVLDLNESLLSESTFKIFQEVTK